MLCEMCAVCRVRCVPYVGRDVCHMSGEGCAICREMCVVCWRRYVLYVM